MRLGKNKNIYFRIPMLAISIKQIWRQEFISKPGTTGVCLSIQAMVRKTNQKQKL